MLGDSVRRSVARSSRGRKLLGKWADRLRRVPTRWRLWLAALAVPLTIGYLIATQLLYPKPPIVAEGTPVPQLVGLSLAAASQTLAQAGLGDPLTTELPSADWPEGVITAQSPLAGQQTRAGRAVRVAVSTGTPRVAVPDVRGFAAERAKTLLRNLGFEVSDTVEESAQPAGRVTATEPGPGAQLRLPATVRLRVSSGPPPDTMAVDTMRADTIAVRWPAVPGGPIFADGERGER